MPSLKAMNNLVLKGGYNSDITVNAIGSEKAINFFFFINNSMESEKIRATVGPLEDVKKKAMVPRIMETHKNFFDFSSIEKEIRIGKLKPKRAANIKGL